MAVRWYGGKMVWWYGGGRVLEVNQSLVLDAEIF